MSIIGTLNFVAKRTAYTPEAMIHLIHAVTIPMEKIFVAIRAAMGAVVVAAFNTIDS